MNLDLSSCFSKVETGRLRREPSYLVTMLPPDVFVSAEVESRGSGSSLQSGSTSSQPLSLHSSPGAVRALKLEADLPEVGAIIDKYRLERLVGVGGFGVVYLATHLLLNSAVAIKMLRPSVLRRKPELASLLFEEARVAARLNHPNVVRVTDVTHHPGLSYVVIEFVDGGSLAELLHRTRRLTPGRALRIGIDVAEGLKAGLAVGITHRDIKPANILLSSATGQAKVADLGLARVQGTTATLGMPTLVGTPGYMAPEQAQDAQRSDFRADIYSLGVTLYQAMVGEPPFPVRDRALVLEQHRLAPPPRPSSRVPDFPPAVEALLLQMLAKKPEHRFASYDALLASLRTIAIDYPPTPGELKT
jgi:eukaryotic-like serine/threonine-protein kinase